LPKPAGPYLAIFKRKPDSELKPGKPSEPEGAGTTAR